MPDVTSVLTAPLIPAGHVAEWTVRPAAAPPGHQPAVLLQIGAQLFAPATEIVPYVAAAARLLAEPAPDGLPVPCGSWIVADPPETPEPVVLAQPAPDRAAQKAGGPADPLARLLWLYWPELRTRAEHRAVFPGDVLRIGIQWDLWYTPAGAVEAAFRAFGADRAVIPTFDIDRRPLAELPDALLATVRLAKLYAAY